MPAEASFRGKSVHIYYVGKENSSHLLPTLFDQHDGLPGFPPDRVCLLALEDNRHNVRALSRLLEGRRVDVEARYWPAIPSARTLNEDLMALAMRFEDLFLLVNLAGFPEELIPDISHSAKDHGWAVYTIREGTDDIHWVLPEEKRDAPTAPDTPDRLRMDHLLAVNGWKALNSESARKQEWLAGKLQEEKDLIDELLQGTDEFSKDFGNLNYLASMAHEDAMKIERERSPGKSRYELETGLRDFASPQLGRKSARLRRLIAVFEEAGYLQLSEQTDRLIFPDDACRFFVNGGWLENHIQHLLKPLTGRKQLIQELVKSLQIESHTGSHQELDIAFMAENCLHIIECKTSRFREIRNPDNPGSQILYKVDYLGDIGGAGTKRMLASYRYVPEAEKLRASDMDIRLVTGPDLLSLEEIIGSWIDSAPSSHG